MNRLGKLVALLTLAGCSESSLLGPGMALTAAEAQGRIAPTETRCGNCLGLFDFEFYIVRGEQLARIRKPGALTYLGTQDGFHFFRSWNKMLKEGEIDHVATRLDQCEVSAPRRIDEEEERGRYRGVSIIDGRCVVR